MLITFEGLDGSGKSTQIDMLSKHLDDRGIEHVVTREPGGTLLGENLRQLLLSQGTFGYYDDITELLLLFAGRRDHLFGKIIPYLELGKVVLCDRFTDSTYAYQGGGRGIPKEMIAEMDRIVTGWYFPSITLFFDLTPEEAYRRRKEYPSDDIEKESLLFYRRVRDAYLKRIVDDPDRFRVIDATEPVDKIAQEVQKELKDVM